MVYQGSCCNGSPYSADTQECCSQRVVRRGTCCNSRPINPDTQVCISTSASSSKGSTEVLMQPVRDSPWLSGGIGLPNVAPSTSTSTQNALLRLEKRPYRAHKISLFSMGGTNREAAGGTERCADPDRTGNDSPSTSLFVNCPQSETHLKSVVGLPSLRTKISRRDGRCALRCVALPMCMCVSTFPS